MYPPRLIQRPLLWELGNKFKVVTNIRQAGSTLTPTFSSHLMAA